MGVAEVMMPESVALSIKAAQHFGASLANPLGAWLVLPLQCFENASYTGLDEHWDAALVQLFLVLLEDAAVHNTVDLSYMNNSYHSRFKKHLLNAWYGL